MALTRTNLVGTQSGTAIGTASFTTGSASTTAGQLLVVIAGAVTGTTNAAANMTMADSLSNTYTSRTTLDDAWASDDGCIAVWTAPVTNAGSTTWTVDSGADSNDIYFVIVFMYDQADQTGLGAATANNTNIAGSGPDGVVTMTLGSAPASTSEVIGVWLCDFIGGGVGGVLQGSGYTEQYDVKTTAHAGIEVETRTGSTSTTCDVQDIDVNGGSLLAAMALAFEVKYLAPSAPDAPAAPLAEQRGNAAYVSWTAPAANGSAITDYVIQYSENGGAYSTFSDGTSTAVFVTVTGLNPNSSYTFKVKATNGVGDSSYSSASNAVVPYEQTELARWSDNTIASWSDGGERTWG